MDKKTVHLLSPTIIFLNWERYQPSHTIILLNKILVLHKES